MSDTLSPVVTIAAKDVADASRDRFVVIVTAFLTLAALTALVTGAIALSTDVATYDAARATLLALGKPASALAPPEFYPLKLLRGAIEQIEIIGAAIGILIGYRAAASERGRQTLMLILTRPLDQWQFLAGKALGGTVLLAGGLAVVLIVCAIALHFVSGIGLGLADLGRLAIVWAAASLYTIGFYLMSFIAALWMKRLPNALLLSFAVWLVLVLIAPQIGDTLDPDNQVAGGVFRQLHIAKPDQVEIMKGFSGFETVRTGIEAVSVTKHFERFSFAVLGIKDSYTGKPLAPILVEKWGDLAWILGFAMGLGALLFSLRINANRLVKE